MFSICSHLIKNVCNYSSKHLKGDYKQEGNQLSTRVDSDRTKREWL